jgi:hypothetical protein
MYENRVLAFIDILGFSKAVEKTIQKDGIEDFHETQKIDNLLNEIQWQMNGKDYLLDELRKKSKVTSHFSDSIIISYLPTEKLSFFYILLDIYYLCINIVQKGFLLRGAIVVDKVYHTKEKIFGPALVKAYNMEKNEAVFPRVIIDQKIFIEAEKYYSRFPNSDDEYKYLEKLTLKDFDSFNYINYFEIPETGVIHSFEERINYLNDLRKIIEEMNIKEDNSLKCKYLWVKEKYDIAYANIEPKYSNS